MCGRYLFTQEDDDDLLDIANVLNETYGADAWHPGDMTPSSRVPSLILDSSVHPVLQRWGIPVSQRLVINSRAETAAEKPLFRDSLSSRRCALPCSGFYEWDAQKRKFLFTMVGTHCFFLAGIWQHRDGEDHCCVLTTAANASMAPVHHRMPVLLTRDMVQPWLSRPEETQAFLTREQELLARECLDAQVSLW